MRYDDQKLTAIYNRTQGCCHLCHRRLRFSSYGIYGLNGAWHVEHSKPKARGGTNHSNNLFAACIGCNYEKGIRRSATIRKRNGHTRAPYSRKKVERVKEENSFAAMVSGALLGLRFGPIGAIAGAVIGGLIGEDVSPKK